MLECTVTQNELSGLKEKELHLNNFLNLYNVNINTVPVKPHQVGHLLVSFTTPAANMSRKSSHFTSQKHKRSLGSVICFLK